MNYKVMAPLKTHSFDRNDEEKESQTKQTNKLYMNRSFQFVGSLIYEFHEVFTKIVVNESSEIENSEIKDILECICTSISNPKETKETFDFFTQNICEDLIQLLTIFPRHITFILSKIIPFTQYFDHSLKINPDILLAFIEQDEIEDVRSNTILIAANLVKRMPEITDLFFPLISKCKISQEIITFAINVISNPQNYTKNNSTNIIAKCIDKGIEKSENFNQNISCDEYLFKYDGRWIIMILHYTLLSKDVTNVTNGKKIILEILKNKDLKLIYSLKNMQYEFESLLSSDNVKIISCGYQILSQTLKFTQTRNECFSSNGYILNSLAIDHLNNPAPILKKSVLHFISSYVEYTFDNINQTLFKEIACLTFDGTYSVRETAANCVAIILSKAKMKIDDYSVIGIFSDYLNGNKMLIKNIMEAIRVVYHFSLTEGSIEKFYETMSKFDFEDLMNSDDEEIVSFAHQFTHMLTVAGAYNSSFHF
ncbi:hypothetical protein TRFO_31530 [Tritrichomonas foetus]|uniref:Uncharacterized protein n=1 Tax=Tritrichomonas foetus TaxID=1144522 RepID=A0A1J4JRI4_9EUKA|nr:hypothetical protein TRFO_31530 [Tritrichomonas foetus]|eukprot:OHT01643.1 hypothetical protein TRFO_31530 [Tritrichomonas foetus]